MRKWLMVVLLISVCCLTYFSYVGMYNFINYPISYLNERYSQIYGDLSEKYYTVRETQKNDMKENIFSLINEVNSKYITLDKTINKNNELESKLEQL